MSAIKYSLIIILISIICTQTQGIGQTVSWHPIVGGPIQIGSYQTIQVKTAGVVTLSLVTGVSNTILLAPALLNENGVPSPLTGFTYSYTINNLPVWASFSGANNTLKINPPLTYRGGAQIEIVYLDSKNIKQTLKANLGLKNGIMQYDFIAIQQQYRFQNTFTLAFPIFSKNNSNSVIVPGKYHVIDCGIYPWLASVSLSKVTSAGVMSNYGVGYTIGQVSSPVMTQTVNVVSNQPVVFPITTQTNNQLGHYVNYQSQQINTNSNSNIQSSPMSNMQESSQVNNVISNQVNNQLKSQNNPQPNNQIKQQVNVVNIATNNNNKDMKEKSSSLENTSKLNIIKEIKTNQIVPKVSSSKIITTSNIIQPQNYNSFVGKVLTSYSGPQSKAQVSEVKGTVLPIVYQHPITNSNQVFGFAGGNKVITSQTIHSSAMNQNRNMIPGSINGGINQIKLQVQQQQSQAIAHPPIINSQQNQIVTTSSQTSSALNSAPPLINGHGIVIINERTPVQVISHQSGNSIPPNYLNNAATTTATTTTTTHNSNNINTNINNNTNLGTYINNNISTNTNMNNNVVTTSFPTVNTSSIQTNIITLPVYQNNNNNKHTQTTTTTTHYQYSPSTTIQVTPVPPPQLSNLSLNSQTINQLIPAQQTYVVGELPLIPLDQSSNNVVHRIINTTYIQHQPLILSNYTTASTSNQPLIKTQSIQNSNLLSNLTSNSQSNLVNGQIMSFTPPSTQNIQGGIQSSSNIQLYNNTTVQQLPQVLNTQAFQSSPSTITINRTYVTTSPMSLSGNSSQVINNSTAINNDLTSLLNQLNLTIPKDLLDSSKYQTHTTTTTTTSNNTSLLPLSQSSITSSSNSGTNGITTTQPLTSTYTITKPSESLVTITSPVITNLTNSINSIGSNLSALGITVPSK